MFHLTHGTPQILSDGTSIGDPSRFEQGQGPYTF